MFVITPLIFVVDTKIIYGYNLRLPKYEIIYLDQRKYELPKFSTTRLRFEICTLEIGYRQNFITIRKLVLFSPKCTNLGIWAKIFQKSMSNLNAAPSK